MISARITRRRVLESIAAMASYPLVTGRGSAASSENPQPKPPGPLTEALVSVDASSAGSIGEAFAGFSYEKVAMYHTIFSASNSSLTGLFKLLGPSLLRIGGDSSDKIVWTPKGRGGIYKQVTPGEVDRLAGFVKATGWKCLYTVNLAGSSNGTTTPALAAAEVAYVAQQFGQSLYGIEIGNEPDSYVKPGRQYADRPWTLALYETTWNQYRTAILAAAPGVMITGPAAGKLPVWTIPFSKDQTKSKLSLLTDHYYRGSGKEPGSAIDKLLTPDSRLLNNLEMMQAASRITGIPFRIAECNTFTGGVPGASDSYASALWSLDFLFECAQGGARGVNFHGGGPKASYSPLMDDNTNVVAVRPEFYGILLFTLAGSGTVYRTKISAGSLNASAYAVKTLAGTSVVILNKDNFQNLHATVELPQNVKSANLMVLSQRSPGTAGPDLSANSGVTIQGATVGIDGTFSPSPAFTPTTRGSQLICYVPSLTAVLIRTAA